MVCLLVSAAASAAEITVPVNVAEKQGVGAAVGVVRIVETPYGLAFVRRLRKLDQMRHEIWPPSASH
jgi:superoxide dismutase, Cu-Zn family